MINLPNPFLKWLSIDLSSEGIIPTKGEPSPAQRTT